LLKESANSGSRWENSCGHTEDVISRWRGREASLSVGLDVWKERLKAGQHKIKYGREKPNLRERRMGRGQNLIEESPGSGRKEQKGCA